MNKSENLPVTGGLSKKSMELSVGARREAEKRLPNVPAGADSVILLTARLMASRCSLCPFKVPGSIR